MARLCSICGLESPLEEAFTQVRGSSKDDPAFICPACQEEKWANQERGISRSVLVNSGLALLIVVSYLLTHFKTSPRLHYEFVPEPGASTAEFVLSLATHLLFFLGVVLPLLLIFAQAVSTVIHELGHVIAGLFVRLRLFRFAIGYGPVILRSYIFRTLVEIRLIPICGYVLHGYPTLTHIRKRTVLFVLGGPTANLAVAIILSVILFSSSTAHLVDFPIVQILLYGFVAVNLFDLFITLIPMRVRMPRLGRTPNDGLILARIPSLTDEILVTYHISYFQEEGRCSSEKGQHEEAKQWYEAGMSLYPDNFMLLFCVGNVQVRLGQFARSRECLLPLLTRKDLLPLHRPHVLDTIAWANLMRGDPGLLEETDRFSKEAFEAMPWSSYFAGTRGAVLVELGQTEAGMELLRTALKKNKDAYNKAVNACYLALGEAGLGNVDAAKKHLEMARKLDAKCPVLERIAENVQNASIN
jgi:hypothetical protein